MLSPLLIIGLGGAGGKTIRAMKQSMLENLRSRGYEGEIPEAWQFLQIDTAHDGIDFPAPMLPRNEVHLVIQNGETLEDVNRKLENLGPLTRQQTLLAGWSVPQVPLSIVGPRSAGRALGREFGIADAKQILSALSTAVFKMRGPIAMADLAQIAKFYGVSNLAHTPKAILISSLTGASGSGMFLDVAELLKRASPDSWAQESVAFLYTPDVFENLGAASANGSMNSLATINEIIAGKSNGLSDGSLLLLDSLGIPRSKSDDNQHFGCKINILVGASNSSGANFVQDSKGAGMEDLFLNIGEALAGTFMDDGIAEFLFNRAFVGIFYKKLTVDNSSLAPEVAGKDTLPFTGIGFGRITLGTDQLVKYVADAMARRQIEKLLWPELNPELLKDGNRSDLIKTKANELWPTFLESSGLDDRGSQDQVLNELRPSTIDTEIRTFVTKLVKDSFPGKAQDVNRISRKLWSEWESGAGEVQEKLRQLTRQNALAWRSKIQKDFADLVSHEIAMNGFVVSIALIEKLEEEISQHGVTSLRREQEDAENALKGFVESSWPRRFDEMVEGKTGLSSSDTDVVSKAANTFVKVLNTKYNAYLKDFAASLMQDFVSGYLRPLRDAIANARYELEQEWLSDVLPDGQTNPKKWFPEWGSKNIPEKYKPRSIERTLIPPTEFEDFFNLYAGREAGDSDLFDRAVRHALLGTKLNAAIDGGKNQRFISIESTRVGTVQENEPAKELSAVTVFDFTTGINDLLRMNQIWLRDPETAFGAFVQQSIRDFVEAHDDAEQRSKREDIFIDAYQAILGLSHPLARLNRLALNHVISVSDGGPADGVMNKTSKIPFAADSRVGRRCTDILNQFGVQVSDDGFANHWFDSDSNEKSVYSISTSQASLPAWAFESLTAPIAKQVTISKNSPELWSQFWEERRSRPLVESVPLSSEIRRSMVTGWFIARLFNMLETELLPVGRSARIWNPNLPVPGWSQFPKPLLPTTISDSNRNWLLPSVLLSSGLALVELGETGSLESIHPYQLLKFIGREVTASSKVARDTWDDKGLGDRMPNQRSGRSTFIVDWINSGTTPSPGIEVSPMLKADAPTPDDRKAAFLKTIEKIQAEYAEAWVEIEKLPWYEIPETWELKDDINLALSDIFTYVQSINEAEPWSTSI